MEARLITDGSKNIVPEFYIKSSFELKKEFVEKTRLNYQKNNGINVFEGNSRLEQSLTSQRKNMANNIYRHQGDYRVYPDRAEPIIETIER